MGRLLIAPAAALVALLLLGLAPLVAPADQAWVRGNLRLNLRTGPGTQYRILAALKTGDDVSVLDRTDEWIKIRDGNGREGWIPSGYLQSEPPPSIVVSQLKTEAAGLRDRFEEARAELDTLRSAKQELDSRHAQQLVKLEELSRENLRLRAGARWPEWVAGAGILTVGMLIGAVLHRNATRRPAPRIRL